MVKKVRRQATGWEKIFEKKRLIKRSVIQNVQKKFLNSTIRKQTTQSKNRSKNLTDTSPKVYTQKVNKHMKRCSTSYVIREM